MTAYYAQQHQVALDDPLISPTYGRFEKLAPAYIVAAGHDVLHDEAEIYAHKLRQQGLKVHYQEYEDQAHGFINLTPVSLRAKKYLTDTARNFRRFWDRKGS